MPANPATTRSRPSRDRATATPTSCATQARTGPQVTASALAYAALDAIRDVLPNDWQRLPDATDTASVLAGTLANHYAAAAVETEADDG